MIAPTRAPDWSDCHHGPVAPDIRTARAAFECGFDRLPAAMDWALKARDAVVRPFGLATVTDGTLSMKTLPILTETAHRFEVGLEDTHLTFTLQTDLQAQSVAVTTRIWFNNWMGRVYLAAVVVPHKLILRHAIRSIAI